MGPGSSDHSIGQTILPPVEQKQHLPLYFDLREVVVGRGFIAVVRMRGRATCVEDFGSTWIYGVNPGALAEHGSDLKAACANFRRSLIELLFDFAELAADFDTFCRAVSEHFRATDRESVDEWIEARREVRRGRVPEVDLPRESGDLEPDLQVRDLVKTRPSELTPALNEQPAPRERLAA